MAPATIQDDSQVAERSRDRRADAWAARTALWTDSTLDRVRSCGHHSVRQSGEVAVRVSTTGDGRRVAGFAGVATCGSVWACPVCARKIAAARQSELELAISRWEALGGCVALGTFTVSHRAGQRLSTVWDAVSTGWGKVTSGRAWRQNQKTYGVEGWCRVVETTVGVNGWHVHVHTVLFLHHGLGQVERAALTAGMLGRWKQGIGKHGFSASQQHGGDIRMGHGFDAAKVLADYFTKGVYEASGDAGAQAALEVTRGDLKAARGDSRTPFRVLADYMATGDCDDLATWHEWERGSKGRRQMTWAKDFRAMLKLTAERSDDEIAGEELGSVIDDVVVLPKQTWNVLRWRAYLLLDVLEQASVPLAKTWLDRHELEWRDPGS